MDRPRSVRATIAIGELLPEPFSALTGKLIAEQTDWLALGFSLNQTPDAKLVIAARDQDATRVYADLVQGALDFIQAYPGFDQVVLPKDQAFVLSALQPTTQGQQVTVSAKSLLADRTKLVRALRPQVETLRKAAGGATRVNNMRQLALSMHNYESAFKHFPTQGIVAEDGRLLLSWRVSVLPFLGYGELYDRFRLDEPWDSEHNLKLVSEMPSIFRDPARAAIAVNRAGKTTMLGVAGTGAMFDGANERGFGSITDGSSNTALIVNVAAEHAVPWTQPVDWQVDLDNPLEQLRAPERTHVDAAFGDGSAHRLSLDLPVETWRRLVLIADGEIVDWNEE